MTGQIPILYSFRRCPYAMRARMALFASGQVCALREVILADKPQELLTASAKATVPVLVLPDDTVIDQSLDIMLWALTRNDPQNWLACQQPALELIAESDGPFKHSLDRYKYSTRYPGEISQEHQRKGQLFLTGLDVRLAKTPFLLGPGISLADIAIFPFVRQFANTDWQWFDQLNLPNLHNWLAERLHSELFTSVMKKYPQWKTGDEDVRFVV